MLQAHSDGKFPKKPEFGNFLEICWKDFRNFREKYNENDLELLSLLVMEREDRIRRPEVLQVHKEQLDAIKGLIERGNERAAFTQFYRTFPTCLPHRSRQRF